MTAAAGDAHPFPIYACRYRAYVFVWDGSGDPVATLTTPDTERSIDGATMGDASNEASSVGNGWQQVDFTATETTATCTPFVVKSANGKTTPDKLFPVRMPVIRSGTAQAGGGSTMTLDSGASAVDGAYVGCYLRCSNNTPSNVEGQARLIVGYVGSTKVATVAAAWGTNPSSSTTFEILIPVAAAIQAWLNSEPNGLVSGRVDATVGAMQANVMTAAAAASDLTTELQSGLATASALSTVAGYIDTEVAAIKAKTDNLPASPAAVSDIPTANQNADALLDRTAGVETSWTLRQAMRVVLAVLAGKSSGHGTSTVVYRDMADSKDRVSATVSSGNRSAVTRDAS